MILIAGNNISSIYLSAYLEQQNIDYRRVFTHEITDYTFYRNDITHGMEKRALDRLDISPDPVGAGKPVFRVLMGTESREIDGSFEKFMESAAKKTQDVDGLNKFGEMVSSIGKEWKETVDRNFSVKISRDSIMARNFMKSYKDFLFQTVNDKSLRSMLLTFVPRTDISLNTAAGYIYSQLFDGSAYENHLEELTKKLFRICSSENQIRIDSFDDLRIDRKMRRAKINGETFSFDTYIKLYDNLDPQIRLMTYYVESKTFQNTCTFLRPDNMREHGIEQMILWSDGREDRLDVYYSAEYSEPDIDSYVKGNIDNVSIRCKVGYEQLKKQYGNGNFAGWAFNVKENAKNPIICRDPYCMDLSAWGNAHFTCGLVALTNIDRMNGGNR